MRTDTCPYCGGKMEEGTIEVGRLVKTRIYWRPVSSKSAWTRFDMPKGGVRLTQVYERPAAYHCRACRKVIMDELRED